MHSAAAGFGQMDPCTGRKDSGDNVEPLEMSYKLLQTITNDFSEDRIIGHGGFGVVYKGTLENGKPAAVKVIREMFALDNEAFKNEFQNVARLKHDNIVQLLGYCDDQEEETVVLGDGTKVQAFKMRKALCFEYVENGSLQGYISDENQGLEWHIRFKIIQGICEGLKHLRVGLEKPLWHLDLKPDNILLDGKMTPKIADFGIARLIIGDEKTRQTVHSVGTIGYWPPEFVRFQFVSEKFDIFSLGVIIAKTMIGSKGYNDYATMPPRKLVKKVHNIWKERLQETVKPRALESYCQQVKACIEIASKCLAEDRTQRPRVQDIVVTLNEVDTVIPMEIEQFDNGLVAATSNSGAISDYEKGGGEASRFIYTENSRNHPDVMPRKLPLSLIQKMTNNFSKERIITLTRRTELYMGVNENEQVVFVRKLSDYFYDDESFKEIIEINHKNIIQLLGYCSETMSQLEKIDGRFAAVEVKFRALCFEYMRKGSLERHISDAYHGHDWCTRYKIIKGTCDGLNYLHEGRPNPYYHLNLKPSNILLDENMNPKIADVGVNAFMDDGTHMMREIFSLDMTYIPPEFISKQVITKEFDIYSLGIIILEIITGTSEFPLIFVDKKPDEFIELVLGNWRKRLEATLKPKLVESYCQQVKKCIEIALNCVEEDRLKRPNTGDIIRMLNETEKLNRDADHLLHVHPMELRFPFRPREHVSCLLQLLNKDDDRVAFMLQSNNQKGYLTKLPLRGVVPPRGTYTLALTTSIQPQWPPAPDNSDEGFVLQSKIVSDHQERQLRCLDQASIVAKYDNLFARAPKPRLSQLVGWLRTWLHTPSQSAQKVADDEVQKVTLKSICAPPAEEASSKPSKPDIEIKATPNAQRATSIEVHPEKPWIMTTHDAGHLRIWNYNTMEVLNPIEVPDEPVYVAKFITQDEWIVAGDGNGHIHVYSYDGSEEATSFEAHNGRIISLAVHPTDSYVLSASQDDDHLIKLWHWDPCWDLHKGSWECKATFEGHSNKVSQVLFNQKDTDSFVSASWDGTVKFWDLKSNVCNTTITLDNHPDPLLCVDYLTVADHPHLITGSKDGTAQIWDLETKRHIENLQGHTHQISVVYYHPELQKLITGSLDGTVRIWDSTTYRLENIIAFNLGEVYDFGYIEDLQRIVVGCREGIAMINVITRLNGVFDRYLDQVSNRRSENNLGHTKGFRLVRASRRIITLRPVWFVLNVTTFLLELQIASDASSSGDYMCIYRPSYHL